jgi:hypothetical protein
LDVEDGADRISFQATVGEQDNVQALDEAVIIGLFEGHRMASR